MSGYKTIFDREFRNEDKEFLSDKILDGQSGGKGMLLRAYSTEIFEPNTGEMEAATLDECSLFLQATAETRKRMSSKSFFRRHLGRILACAASLAIVGVCMAVFLKGTPKGGAIAKGGSSSNISGFRGSSGGVQPTSALGTSDNQQTGPVQSLQEPLAYLVDVTGNVAIKRGSSSAKAESGCEVLYAGDLLSLDINATAKVMYEDSFFDIIGPNEYQIASPSPLKIEADNERRPVEPSFTTRGAGVLNNVKTMAIAPKNLLVQIVAPVTRAGSNLIPIFSPHGASFTSKPAISIGGDSGKTYLISILDLTGSTVGKPISLKGNSSVEWKTLSSKPLQEDEIYAVRVTCDGKIVNDANNSNFWLMSKEDSQRLMDDIKRFDKLESPEAKEFFKANALYMNGCYSEARAIAMKLTNTTPNNPLYANLVKLCNNAMGVK